MRIPDGITKRELETLKRWGYSFSDEKANGQRIHRVIMIVHNPRQRHDSGYPYIRAFGEIDNSELIDMGLHDHYLCYAQTNTDAIGKNIWRVMPWGHISFKLSKHFCPGDTLTLDKDGVWW